MGDGTVSIRLLVPLALAAALLITPTFPAFASGVAILNAASPTTQRLMLPADLPEHFEIDVRLDGVFHTFVMERHSLRAPGFRVRAYLPLPA